jgi:hypothetical protein
MSAPVRYASESRDAFSRRVALHASELQRVGTDPVVRDASCVYVEGVLAGMQIALACLQRRERIIDEVARWERRLGVVRARAGE